MQLVLATNNQDKIKEIKFFFDGKGIQVGGVPKGGNEKMAVRIRIAVEHDERQRRSVQDEIVPILLRCVPETKDAPRRFAHLDVFDAPRRPESFHTGCSRHTKLNSLSSGSGSARRTASPALLNYLDHHRTQVNTKQENTSGVRRDDRNWPRPDG